MSMESELGRIANALEAICLKAGPVLARVAVADKKPDIAQPTDSGSVTASVEETPKRRGRPPKAVEEQPVIQEGTSEPELSFAGADSSFLDEDVDKVYTREDVRAALVAYQKRTQNPDKARALLKKVGGVDTLNALPENMFSAVIAAVTAA